MDEWDYIKHLKKKSMMIQHVYDRIYEHYSKTDEVKDKIPFACNAKQENFYFKHSFNPRFTHKKEIK